jgi:hypothetical protein
LRTSRESRDHWSPTTREVGREQPTSGLGGTSVTPAPRVHVQTAGFQQSVGRSVQFPHPKLRRALACGRKEGVRGVVVSRVRCRRTALRCGPRFRKEASETNSRSIARGVWTTASRRRTRSAVSANRERKMHAGSADARSGALASGDRSKGGRWEGERCDGGRGETWTLVAASRRG